jgi:hypothetical protein
MGAKTSEQSPSWLELERVIPLAEVKVMTNLSRDSLKRHHGDKIVQLSPRRQGIKLRNVLAIVNGE